MSNSTSVKVELLDDCVSYVNPITKISKEITYEDFLELLQSSVKSDASKKTMDETWLLPKNCAMFDKTDRSVNMLTYHPSCVKSIQYYNCKSWEVKPSSVIEHYEILTPNVLISFPLVKSPTKSGWEMDPKSAVYMCTPLTQGNLPKKVPLNPTSGIPDIFGSPFGNTYPGFGMCVGENQMPRFFPDNDFRALNYYYDFMWSTPFNNDLNNKAVPMAWNEWYKYLASPEVKSSGKFPYEKLLLI